MPYPTFDRSQLRLLPLAERVHDFHLDEVIPLDADLRLNDSPEIHAVARRIVEARQQDKPVILMMGAHVIKSGLSRFVIDLMERGILTHIGVNGACAIHDYELALIGATTESVARYIQEGQFGLWTETGQINDIVRQADPPGWVSARLSERRSPRAIFPTKRSAFSPPATGCASRSPSTWASAMTSSTNTPTATARPWAGPPITIFW